LNLIVNAAQAMPPGKMARLTFAPPAMNPTCASKCKTTVRALRLKF